MVTYKPHKPSAVSDHAIKVLRESTQVLTKAIFWKIPHNSGKEDICLKIGRYKKTAGILAHFRETLECANPKSELTLNHEEFENLISFIQENYLPFKDGAKQYIPLDTEVGQESIDQLKSVFADPDKEKLLSFIIANQILPQDLVSGLEVKKKAEAIKQYEQMLDQNLLESAWQAWFIDNCWVLGTEFVKILDERAIDTEHIGDYLVEAYDGFLDIVEIKRPSPELKFWSPSTDHGNYYPSSDLVKAITQASSYIYEVEKEANSVEFLERMGIKTIKPRCTLIFGRSNDWVPKQKEAYRLLNASYHNLTILTYDHVLERAKRITATPTTIAPVSESDLPF